MRRALVLVLVVTTMALLANWASGPSRVTQAAGPRASMWEATVPSNFTLAGDRLRIRTMQLGQASVTVKDVRVHVSTCAKGQWHQASQKLPPNDDFWDIGYTPAKCLQPGLSVITVWVQSTERITRVFLEIKNGNSSIGGFDAHQEGHDTIIGSNGSQYSGYSDSCPPRKDGMKPPKNGKDMDGDTKIDWLMQVHRWKVTTSDGITTTTRTFTVYVWCLDHGDGGDWSFSVGQTTFVGGISQGGTYSPAPSNKAPTPVPNARLSTCPFPGGQNRELWDVGKDTGLGLPTEIRWYSRLPDDWWSKEENPPPTPPNPSRRLIARKGTIQITTFDVTTKQFRQEWSVPPVAGQPDPHPSYIPLVPYPPPAPPRANPTRWNRYLKEGDLGPLACAIDDDADRLGNAVETILDTDPSVNDTDGDGVPDADELELGADPVQADSLPEDITVPGTCGDGIDNDLDGFTDGDDDGCVDGDGDDIPDGRDNCPSIANSDQRDSNGDGIGGACDEDDDDDGEPDVTDECLGTRPDESVDDRGCGVDPDFDGACAPGTTGTLCTPSDNCPDTFNPTQLDTDGDGLGNACDPFPVGGLVADLAGSSTSGAGVLAAVIAGGVAGAFALGGGAWYARWRRR